MMMIDLEQIGVPAFALSVSAEGQFRFIGINALHEARSGLTSSAVAGRTPHELFEPMTAGRLCRYYQACLDHRSVVDYDVAAQFPTGRSWWRASIWPLLGDSGSVETILGTCHEVSSERRAELDLKTANDHLDLAIRCLKGADWRFDVKSGRYQASNNLALLMGEEQPRPVEWDEWVGRIVADDVAGASCDILLSGAAAEQVVRFRFCNNRNEIHWAQCQRLISGRGGPAPVISGIILDVTDDHRREMRLEDEAHRDSLTGLLNRRGFKRDLDRALAASRDPHPPTVGLFMLDLDGFKQTNDRHGHAAGDEVLIEVGRRLVSVLGERATIARLGGDEFVAAIPAIAWAEARALERQLAEALARPLHRKGARIGVSGSVGLSWRWKDIDVHAMMTEADGELYAIKRARKAQPSADHPEAVLDQMNLFAA